MTPSPAAPRRPMDVNRRDEVGRLQHAADVSLAWFEQVERYWAMEPSQFAFSLMSRSKAITYDNLRTPRRRVSSAAVDRDFAAGVAERENLPEIAAAPPPPMFTPLTIGKMRLQNRVVVAPMCQYCAEDGVPGEWHYVHLTSRALGGAGLVYTEMCCIGPDARITPGCAGIWNDAQEAAWKTHRRFRARIQRRQALHADRPCRAQGRDETRLGGDRPAAGSRRVGDRGPVAAPLSAPFGGPPARWTAPTWTG